MRRHGQARNIQVGPPDRAGRGLCRGRDRASAMARAVPQHHARLGPAARAGHRRDRRRRDPGGHGPGGDSTVAPRGRHWPGALCRVRLSGEHQARARRDFGPRRERMVALSRAAPGVSAGHRLVGLVRRRSDGLALRPEDGTSGHARLSRLTRRATAPSTP